MNDLMSTAAATWSTGVNATSISNAIGSGTLTKHVGPQGETLISLTELRALAQSSGLRLR